MMVKRLNNNLIPIIVYDAEKSYNHESKMSKAIMFNHFNRDSSIQKSAVNFKSLNPFN
jgi:hypothetical protein